MNLQSKYISQKLFVTSVRNETLAKHCILYTIQVMHIRSNQFQMGKIIDLIDLNLQSNYISEIFWDTWEMKCKQNTNIYLRNYLWYRWDMKCEQNTAYYAGWSHSFESAIKICTSEIICNISEKWNVNQTLNIIQVMHIRFN